MDATAFLRRNQPMPPADRCTEDQMISFRQVMESFESEPDDELIPLLFGSMGDGDGSGMYDVLVAAIARRPREVLLHPLLNALRSHHPGTRYWATCVAMETDDPVYEDCLILSLDDSDSRVRWAATLALSDMPSTRVDGAFLERLDSMQKESTGSTADRFQIAMEYLRKRELA